jgi:hypothetical protein
MKLFRFQTDLLKNFEKLIWRLYRFGMYVYIVMFILLGKISKSYFGFETNWGLFFFNKVIMCDLAYVTNNMG